MISSASKRIRGPAAEAEPPPGQLALDLFDGDGQPGGKALDDHDQGSAVGLPGGQEAQHDANLLPGRAQACPKPGSAHAPVEKGVGHGVAPHDRRRRPRRPGRAEGDPGLAPAPVTAMKMMPMTAPRRKPAKKPDEGLAEPEPSRGQADDPGQTDVTEAHALGDAKWTRKKPREGGRPGDGGLAERAPPVVDGRGHHEQRDDRAEVG